MGNFGVSAKHRLHILIKANKCTLILHLVTIIRSREDSNALATVLYHITLVLNFVRSHHKGQIVGLQEVFSDIRAKRVADATFRCRTSHLRLRVCKTPGTEQNRTQQNTK